MSKVFDQVKGLLAELTSAELGQLAERISALQTLGGQGKGEGLPSAETRPNARLARSGRDFEAFAELLYGALADAFQRETGTRWPTYGIQRRTKRGAAFAKAALAAYEAHCSWFAEVSRVELVKLVRIYAVVVVARGAKWGWQGVVNELAALGTNLSDAFPGYIRSGLQSVILASHAVSDHK